MSTGSKRPFPTSPPRVRFWPQRWEGLGRAGIVAMILGAVLILLLTHLLLTARKTEDLRAAAGEEADLHARALSLEIRQSAPIAPLLAEDRAIRAIVASARPAQILRDAADARLDEVRRMTNVAGVFLVDADGGLLAGSGALSLPGSAEVPFPFARPALLAAPGAFFAARRGEGLNEIYFTHPVVTASGRAILVVRSKLVTLAGRPVAAGHLALSTPAAGVIYSTLGAPSAARPVPLLPLSGAVPAPLSRVAGGALPLDWLDRAAVVDLGGAAHVPAVADVGELGLRLHYFAPTAPVAAAVRTVLAIEVMAMAVAAALVLLVSALRTRRAYAELARESDALRDLNRQLADEVDERRRVERELSTAQEGLAQASRLAALGQMSAAISHELSQPLAAMKTYLAGGRLLIDRGRAEEADQSLGRLDALIDRMAALTRQLKGFARKSGDDVGPVDLGEAARGALAVMAPQITSSGVRLVTDFPADPVVVRGDQLRLEQIFVNLMRNALDATASSALRVVTVIVRRDGAMASAVIADTGAGLPPGMAGRVFEPFFTTKQPGEGLGLGLALSAGTASDLGGSLTAAPRPGGGARFELRLPALDGPARRLAAE